MRGKAIIASNRVAILRAAPVISTVPPGRDVLRWPLLGSFLRWRWGRLALQTILLAAAALMVYDGFTGPQLAPQNMATVLAWVEYRGLIMLGFLLAGNLFCAACPFALLRSVAYRMSARGPRWPRFLRNKWVSVASLILLFWLYEWLGLWASPWLTAWVVVAYFAASFALEAVFRESPFCKYVCPLGAFNFTYSTASPLRIQARSPEVCRTCVGKECIRGSHTVAGCGTELYVPRIETNLDCTMCLDCVRACPYDNVALAIHPPLRQPLGAAWPARWDTTFLIVSLSFMGLSNAFGMVPPAIALQSTLAAWGISSSGLRVLAIFLVGNVLLPALALTFGTSLSNALLPPALRQPARAVAARYAPAFVPMGLGVWIAHYGFHFVIGGATLLPVLQSFALDHAVTLLGASPQWNVGFLLPLPSIFPLQVVVLLAAFIASLAVCARRALRTGLAPLDSLRELLPWAIVLTVITIAALSVFNLPMQMRGTFLAGPR
jgi:hypothetical protein